MPLWEKELPIGDEEFRKPAAATRPSASISEYHDRRLTAKNEERRVVYDAKDRERRTAIARKAAEAAKKTPQP